MQSAEYSWKGDAAGKAIRAATVKGLRTWLEYVLGETRQVVPIEEGTLERSGTTSVDERTLTGAISYDTPYAVVQHEDLTLTHAPGRTAKYLERPWVANAKLALPMIRKAVRKVTQ